MNMASSNQLVSLTFAMAIFAHGTVLAAAAVLHATEIECERLHKDSCVYAVSSSGKRCMLEKHVWKSGAQEYTCWTSEVDAADEVRDWIETDECVKACGLDRSVLGISSDFLLESRFVEKLCSNDCYHNCPNVVDLFFNLAAGEGVYLPKFCESKGGNGRRGLAEIASSGHVTAARVDSLLLNGPALAPC